MASDQEAIKSALRAHILADVLPGEPAEHLRDDTPLRTSGVLDSMAMLRLVSFVEDTFGITVEAHEAGVENFDRIADMAAFIEKKRA